jgi:hypothetical protein
MTGMKLRLTNSVGGILIATFAHSQSFHLRSDVPLEGEWLGWNPYISIIDIDGDGDFDVFSGADNEILFLKNTGTPSQPIFAPVQPNPFGLNPVGFGQKQTFSDLDNDGDLDILTRNNFSDFYYFENTGDSLAPAFAPSIINPYGLADPQFVGFPRLTDLNGDNKDDLLLLSGPSIFYSENTGTTSAPAFGTLQIDPFGFPNVGTSWSDGFYFSDVDTDGDLDFVSGNSWMGLLFVENIGTPTSPLFGPLQQDLFGFNTVELELCPALWDMDNDGDTDLVIADLNGHFSYCENVGSPSVPVFQNAFENPFGLTAVEMNAMPTFVDIDFDEDYDCFVGS